MNWILSVSHLAWAGQCLTISICTLFYFNQTIFHSCQTNIREAEIWRRLKGPRVWLLSREQFDIYFVLGSSVQLIAEEIKSVSFNFEKQTSGNLKLCINTSHVNILQLLICLCSQFQRQIQSKCRYFCPTGCISLCAIALYFYWVYICYFLITLYLYFSWIIGERALLSLDHLYILQLSNSCRVDRQDPSWLPRDQNKRLINSLEMNNNMK